MSDLDKIWPFKLCRGNSKSPPQGACLLDAVSWFEYGTLGDHPACVSPVLAAIGRAANDTADDLTRQKLREFIVRLAGTVDDEADYERTAYLQFLIIRTLKNWNDVSAEGAHKLNWEIMRLPIARPSITMHQADIAERLTRCLFDFWKECWERVIRRPEQPPEFYSTVLPIQITDYPLTATYKRVWIHEEVQQLLFSALSVGCAIGTRAPEVPLSKIQAAKQSFAFASGKELIDG